jgi:hypothetical protein
MTAVEKNQELGFPQWSLQWGDARWMAPGMLFYLQYLSCLCVHIFLIARTPSYFKSCDQVPGQAHAPERHLRVCVHCARGVSTHFRLLYPTETFSSSRSGLAWLPLPDTPTRASYWKSRPKPGNLRVPQSSSRANLVQIKHGPFCKRAGTLTPHPDPPSELWRTAFVGLWPRVDI